MLPQLSKSLKATKLQLVRDDVFCKRHEHWTCETWSANVLSTAGRAKKDCFKQDNSVTSYLNCGQLHLLQWKLESVSGGRIFFSSLGGVAWKIVILVCNNCLLSFVQKRSRPTAAMYPH